MHPSADSKTAAAVPLQAHGLAFAYGEGEPVLRDVSLELPAGELLALFGPNGAGKSTLLRVLGGLLQPSAGSVQVNGQAITQLSPLERARSVARMPQGLDVWPDVRVADLVWSGRYCHQRATGWGPFAWGAERDPNGSAAVQAAVAATGCDAWWQRSVRELSGGERERVLLARALAQDAPILLADEPTRSLDPEHQLAAFEILREQAQAGRAVLVVTHDWNLASQFADRLICLAAGSVHAQGDPAEVLRPEVLEPIFGRHFHFGELPAGAGPRAPFVLPWRPGPSQP